MAPTTDRPTTASTGPDRAGRCRAGAARPDRPRRGERAATRAGHIAGLPWSP
ncbi:hypothetical protein Ae168Ps1_5445c [Pseudonocardia sp. Ae168_Ps1]|nr:hypothetical protein Ae168Ps1_5445c [Pseudonocardia sp. Ae168_Ps1]